MSLTVDGEIFADGGVFQFPDGEKGTLATREWVAENGGGGTTGGIDDVLAVNNDADGQPIKNVGDPEEDNDVAVLRTTTVRQANFIESDYIIDLTDKGKVIICDIAEDVIVTLLSDADQGSEFGSPFQNRSFVDILRLSASNVTLNVSGDIEFNLTSGSNEIAQYECVRLLKVRANEWVLLRGTAGGGGGTNGIISINERTASYTLQLSDVGKLIRITSLSITTLTVPANSDVAFPIGTQIFLTKKEEAAMSVEAGIGVDVDHKLDKNLVEYYGIATLTKMDTDEWLLTGDVTD